MIDARRPYPSRPIGTPVAAREVVAAAWSDARGRLVEALPREHRDRFEDVVLDLLCVAEDGSVSIDAAAEAERRRVLLRIGTGAAVRLAAYAPDDPEFLAAVVALPWFDPQLLRSRSRLTIGCRPLTWPAAMVLAMAAPESPRRATSDVDYEIHYLRRLAALPPLLRAAVVLERDLAGATARAAAFPMYPARPFDQHELALLAAGLPAGLLPAAERPTGPPMVPSPPPPVDTPSAALALVPRGRSHQFGSYVMSVDGDPGFAVTASELVYVVRWDVPVDAIHRHEPPISVPGDRFAIAFDEPGWIVDRATHEVDAVDLAVGDTASYSMSRRLYPLPPGWRLGNRPPIVDGVALDLAQLLPSAAGSDLQPLLRTITAHYATALADMTWPDYLVAWLVARHAVWTLTGAGFTDPAVLGAALLAARGMAPADTLVDDTSDQWRTEAGELARAARPAADEEYGPGAARRASRLADAPKAARAVAIADARARASVETDLFGVTPQARRAELAGLSGLAAGLPTLHHVFRSG